MLLCQCVDQPINDVMTNRKNCVVWFLGKKIGSGWLLLLCKFCFWQQIALKVLSFELKCKKNDLNIKLKLSIHLSYAYLFSLTLMEIWIEALCLWHQSKSWHCQKSLWKIKSKPHLFFNRLLVYPTLIIKLI